jgi:hypothetical protein
MSTRTVAAASTSSRSWSEVARTNRTAIIAVRIDGSGYVAQLNALRELCGLVGPDGGEQK